MKFWGDTLVSDDPTMKAKSMLNEIGVRPKPAHTFHATKNPPGKPRPPKPGSMAGIANTADLIKAQEGIIGTATGKAKEDAQTELRRLSAAVLNDPAYMARLRQSRAKAANKRQGL